MLLTPTYHVMKMYNVHQDAQLLKIELNYLKKAIKAKDGEAFPPCHRSQRCSSNQRESWCYGKNDQDEKERRMKN